MFDGTGERHLPVVCGQHTADFSVGEYGGSIRAWRHKALDSQTTRPVKMCVSDHSRLIVRNLAGLLFQAKGESSPNLPQSGGRLDSRPFRLEQVRGISARSRLSLAELHSGFRRWVPAAVEEFCRYQPLLQPSLEVRSQVTALAENELSVKEFPSSEQTTLSPSKSDM